MDGFDINDAKKVIDGLSFLKDQIANPFDRTPRPDPQQWSIWGNPGQQPQVQQRTDLPPAVPTPAMPSFETPPQQQIQLRPEQMVGTQQADQATKQQVYQAIDQAKRQNNRTTAAGQFMQAINISNNSHDASLQAMSKVEYGLANMNWGFSEEGFKWILEAGSNNPSLYNPQSNQSFLQRLGQAGLPQGAVDLLISSGQADPNWYLKDANATKKLDQAMTGPVFVAPTGGGRTDVPGAQRPGADPLAPPTSTPTEQVINPQLGPAPSQAGGWIQDQVKNVLRSAQTNSNHQNAFAMYKQATDMADRSGDKGLQTTARVETGVALISWGVPESGFKWLLDAGAKNPALYDSRVNQAFQQRLKAGGIPDGAIALYLANGQRDPNWHLRDANAAKELAAAMRPAAPAPVPASAGR